MAEANAIPTNLMAGKFYKEIPVLTIYVRSLGQSLPRADTLRQNHRDRLLIVGHRDVRTSKVVAMLSAARVNSGTCSSARAMVSRAKGACTASEAQRRPSLSVIGTATHTRPAKYSSSSTAT